MNMPIPYVIPQRTLASIDIDRPDRKYELPFKCPEQGAGFR
jgi:hypothetical protein